MVLPADSGQSYLVHTLFRQLTPVIQMPLMFLSAQGDYRMNYTLFRQQPNHPIFLQGGCTLYESKNWTGRTLQRMFLPHTNVTGPKVVMEETMQSYRRSGARLQGFAGMGLQAQYIGRLGINLYAIKNMQWNGGGHPTLINSILLTDTASLAANLSDGILNSLGRMRVSYGNEYGAARFLTRSHQLNIGASLMMFGAGAMRFGLEINHYTQTGRMNNSTAIYGAMEMAGGAVGFKYSQLVLRQARLAVTLSEQNTALMGRIPLSRGMSGTLRGIGIIGAGAGLATSTIQFFDAVTNDDLPDHFRRQQMISSGLGIAGSGLLMASACLVNPATAPLSGLLFAAGIGVLVAQTVYDYQDELFP